MALASPSRGSSSPACARRSALALSLLLGARRPAVYRGWLSLLHHTRGFCPSLRCFLTGISANTRLRVNLLPCLHPCASLCPPKRPVLETRCASPSFPSVLVLSLFSPLRPTLPRPRFHDQSRQARSPVVPILPALSLRPSNNLLARPPLASPLSLNSLSLDLTPSVALGLPLHPPSSSAARSPKELLSILLPPPSPARGLAFPLLSPLSSFLLPPRSGLADSSDPDATARSPPPARLGHRRLTRTQVLAPAASLGDTQHPLVWQARLLAPHITRFGLFGVLDSSSDEALLFFFPNSTVNPSTRLASPSPRSCSPSAGLAFPRLLASSSDSKHPLRLQDRPPTSTSRPVLEGPLSHFPWSSTPPRPAAAGGDTLGCLSIDPPASFCLDVRSRGQPNLS